MTPGSGGAVVVGSGGGLDRTRSVPRFVIVEFEKDGDVWRVNLYRIDQYEWQQELYAWSPTRCETFHVPGEFGELVFAE